MSLPSDTPRKIMNLIGIGTVKEIDWNSKPRLVRIEVDDGVLSDWMPYAQPFIGGTWFWCAPKVGISGLVFSEGGNNDVCRFYPCFNTEEDDPDLTEDDFELHFKNDDYIKHDAKEGILSFKASKELLIDAPRVKYTTDKIETTGEISAEKRIYSGEDVVALAVSLVNHLHQAGMITTGPPIGGGS